MNEKNDGGPAFPQVQLYDEDGRRSPCYLGGATMLDWFAGQALAGELASQERGEALFEQTPENAALVARRTYKFAEAMLAEREKRRK